MTPLQLFKCLSDETRLFSTLLIFKQSELCVCELTELLNQSQPKISRHLAQLRKCNLLADRRHEQWVYYQLHPELPNWVKSTLEQACTAEQEQLTALIHKLETDICRPGRC